MNLYAGPQTLVKVSRRRRLNLLIAGEGEPTVVFAPGGWASTLEWSRVQHAIAAKTRTVGYDNAGFGFSDPGPLPRTASAIVSDLRAALKAADIPPPYVLAGWSFGGLIMRLFAFRYPRDVVGMVMVDASSERQISRLAGDPKYAAWLRDFRRTFFRHFPDKREVLFDGEAALHAALSRAIAEAPAALGPMEVVLSAFRSIETMLEDNRPFTEPAREVIARTPALQERQLAKAASTTAAVAAALQRRGVEANLATLAAGTGMAVFGHAARSWFDDPSLSLGIHLERAFEALHGLSVSGSPAPRTLPHPVPLQFG